MAFSLTTNRLAKDFNRALHVNFQNTVLNYQATQWSTTPGSTSVPDTDGGAKDALCTTFENTWNNTTPWSGWVFTKNAGNPRISQVYNTSYYEFYPPYPLKDGSNYNLLAKCNGDSYGYSSADGVIWSSDGLLLSKGSSGSWDAAQSSVNVLQKVGSTYYCFYSGYKNSPNFNHAIGIATASSFTGTWAKNVGNPVYDVSAYNLANGTSWDGISVTDIVLIGTTYYYFGTAYNNAFTDGDLIYGVGAPGGSISGITMTNKICGISQLNPAWNWAQGLSVFSHPITGKWMMTITLGTLSSSGTDNQAIYCFASSRTDAPVFTLSDFYCKPIMYPNTAASYEDNYNYAANWLKDINGSLLQINSQYYLYYAGHASGSNPQYTGVTCLATIDGIPVMDPGLCVWYKTDGLVNNTTNSYGTVDGSGNITKLTDLSGAGNYASYVSGTKPTLVGTIGGKTTATFDGVLNKLTISNLALTKNIRGFTMFAVCKSNGLAGSGVVNEVVYFGTESGDKGRCSLIVIYGATPSWEMRARRVTTDPPSPLIGSANISSNTVICGVVDYGTGYGALYENGVLVNEQSNYVTTGATANSNSADSTLGNLSDSGIDYPFNGLIAEIKCYQSVLSAADIISKSNELKSYYGI